MKLFSINPFGALRVTREVLEALATRRGLVKMMKKLLGLV